MRKLKDACQNCSKPLDPSWRICPYCETEVVKEQRAPTRRPRRRRETQAESAPEPTS
jgi:predicted amidophosphoribosyltransferase